jgi:hypothetical protein
MMCRQNCIVLNIEAGDPLSNQRTPYHVQSHRRQVLVPSTVPTFSTELLQLELRFAREGSRWISQRTGLNVMIERRTWMSDQKMISQNRKDSKQTSSAAAATSSYMLFRLFTTIASMVTTGETPWWMGAPTKLIKKKMF